MRRHERHEMTEEARQELAAVDAAISGEAANGEHAPLQELVRALRGVRPQPSGEFLAALDARAARGFRRAGQEHARDSSRGGTARAGVARGATQKPRRRALLALPALGLAVAVVLLAILLPGTGGPGPQPRATNAPSKAVFGAAQAGPAVAPDRAALQPAPAPTAGPSAPGEQARQVERTSTLDVGVAPGNVQATAQRVFTLVNAFSGYVRQSNVNSGPSGQGGATFDVRLPSSNLAAAIASLSHLGHVRSENDTTNDVTEQVSSLQRSVGDQRAQRASLLRQLSQANDPQRAAALKAELNAVEARISQREGQLRALRTRVDYTRLALAVTPEVTAGASTGDLTPSAAAHDAGKILSAALAVLVIAAAAVLPIAAVAIAGWSAVSLTRRRLREQALDAS
ncbi:MAG: protein kinase [Solirubrobacterales bacterium]|nr:protein kinase [Solirubrobacterales bacterium]